MDACVVDEVDDGLVALLVLVTQVLGQVDDQLPAHRLVAVHVADVLELRLTWDQREGERREFYDLESSNTKEVHLHVRAGRNEVCQADTT